MRKLVYILMALLIMSVSCNGFKADLQSWLPLISSAIEVAIQNFAPPLLGKLKKEVSPEEFTKITKTSVDVITNEVIPLLEGKALEELTTTTCTDILTLINSKVATQIRPLFQIGLNTLFQYVNLPQNPFSKEANNVKIPKQLLLSIFNSVKTSIETYNTREVNTLSGRSSENTFNCEFKIITIP